MHLVPSPEQHLDKPQGEFTKPGTVDDMLKAMEDKLGAPVPEIRFHGHGRNVGYFRGSLDGNEVAVKLELNTPATTSGLTVSDKTGLDHKRAEVRIKPLKPLEDPEEEFEAVGIGEVYTVYEAENGMRLEKRKRRPFLSLGVRKIVQDRDNGKPTRSVGDYFLERQAEDRKAGLLRVEQEEAEKLLRAINESRSDSELEDRFE